MALMTTRERTGLALEGSHERPQLTAHGVALLDLLAVLDSDFNNDTGHGRAN